MLTQRIGKSANEFLTAGGREPRGGVPARQGPELLPRDRRGPARRQRRAAPAGTRDPQTKERLAALLQAVRGRRARRPARSWATCRAWWRRATRRPRSWPTASRCARACETLQERLAATGGFDAACTLALMLVSALLLLAGGAGFLRLYVARPGAARAQFAEGQRLEAERQEQEAKRVNDANQAAILRLMNELQTVAEGDLTQQATVTEDITGAIADSVNYTVEELRTLVSQVQGTVARVTDTTQQVEADLDRAAGRLDRAAARDPRHRRVGAADGRPHQRRVGAGAARPPRWRAQSLQAAETGLHGGAEHDRRHERDPRPDPGNLQAHQAAGRVVAGDRRNHRADLATSPSRPTCWR